MAIMAAILENQGNENSWGRGREGGGGAARIVGAPSSDDKIFEQIFTTRAVLNVLSVPTPSPPLPTVLATHSSPRMRTHIHV